MLTILSNISSSFRILYIEKKEKESVSSLNIFCRIVKISTISKYLIIQICIIFQTSLHEYHFSQKNLLPIKRKFSFFSILNDENFRYNE